MSPAPATPRALILLAHGSREERSAEELEGLCRRVGALAPGLEAFPAFLGLRAPDLDQALELALGLGHRSVAILPLFLLSGRHVLEDIPRLAERARAAHPEADIRLLDPIGAHGRFAEAVAAAAGEAWTASP